MGDSLYLAWQYLRRRRVTTGVLVASLALILFLPAALQRIVRDAECHFRSRAAATPLLIGPRGSALELVLVGVYFDKPQDAVMRVEQLRRIEKQQRGVTIPLHTRFTARGCTVVGTRARYLTARGLKIDRGRRWELLGECVVGSSVARRLGVRVGDRLPVDSSSAFVLDSPPLRLRVAGVLAASETPDDEAVFVDLDTAWVIEGLGHGHAADAKHGSTAANPHTDITPENAESFHFHGDRASYPLTSVIVVPKDAKSETLLLGQYFSPDETTQIVRPGEVMDRLFERVLMVRSYLVAAVALVSLVTLLTMALVIVLSVKLRRAELATMSKMGCSRHKIASILFWQITIILSAGGVIAASLAAATGLWGAEIGRRLIF